MALAASKVMLNAWGPPHKIRSTLFISTLCNNNNNCNSIIGPQGTSIVRRSPRVECPGRPVYFLISTLGRSSQSTVKSSLLCPGRLDFIFSVNFYIFGHPAFS
jgi:hypothetical protein